jgi:hypothetical protein
MTEMTTAIMSLMISVLLICMLVVVSYYTFKIIQFLFIRPLSFIIN